jgi:hypothetical protein
VVDAQQIFVALRSGAEWFGQVTNQRRLRVIFFKTSPLRQIARNCLLFQKLAPFFRAEQASILVLLPVKMPITLQAAIHNISVILQLFAEGRVQLHQTVDIIYYVHLEIYIVPPWIISPRSREEEYHPPPCTCWSCVHAPALENQGRAHVPFCATWGTCLLHARIDIITVARGAAAELRLQFGEICQRVQVVYVQIECIGCVRDAEAPPILLEDPSRFCVLGQAYRYLDLHVTMVRVVRWLLLHQGQ